MDPYEHSHRSRHGNGVMGFTELKLRLKALLRRRKFERDVDDELAFHLAMRQEKLSEDGMEPCAARSAAHLRFGNTARAGETLREMRGWGWLERLWQDIHFGLRQLRLNPGFAAGAIIPLGLAIGCAAAILTLTDAVLFRPTGVRDPGSVAAVYTYSRANGRYLSDSYPDFRDVDSLSDVVESAAAYMRIPLSVRLTAGADTMSAELATGNYFRAAGIAPALGRPLTPEDDRPGAAPVALVSFTFWETRYQRSLSVLGSVVWMNGVPFTIVGVMPPGYHGMLLDWYGDLSFWAPLTQFHQLFPGAGADYENRREVQMLMTMARLRPGVSVSQFQAALDVAAARTPAGPNPGNRLLALPAAQARFFPAYRAATIRFLWMLVAVAIAAVAIACFNLANLLLARSAARHREMTTRVAVGASRSRLLQQLIVEHAVLAGCACAVSVPVAMAVTDWLRTVQFTYIFRPVLNLTVDWRALGIGMAAGMVTAVLAGVAPAIKAARSGIAGKIREIRASRAGLRDLLLCAQVGCAMAVLVSAAVLAKTLHDTGNIRLGYDARGVLIGSLDVRAASVDAFFRLQRNLLSEVRSQSAGAALALQALPTTRQGTMDVQTHTGPWKPMPFNWVSDGYFEALRIPITEGRGILSTDDLHSPAVVVVNRAAAALLWPGENPVGRRLRIRQDQMEREIVGLAEDIRVHALDQAEPSTPYLFLPLFQRASPSAASLVVHVRTPGPPLQFAGTLRQIAGRIAPDAALSGVGTLTDHVETGLEPMRVAAQATAAVSLLGVALALAGIFASAAYRVTQQKKEIAIRIAIGAEPARVVRSFAARGIWVGAVGAGMGLPAAVWGVSLLRSAVAGVGSSSPLLLAAATAALILAAFGAAFAAASRIARLQPADVLRVQ
jgi:putative ABC transport system permease protein